MKRYDLKPRIINIMQRQFQVWDGTDMANDILTDTAYAIGSQLVGISAGHELLDFVKECGAR